VAAQLESDILIVDEVLAVGDAGFQKKCMGKMESVANEGRTILFVSHNMGAISELCTTAALLHKGKLVTQGAVPQVIEQYARLTLNEQASGLQFEDDEKKPSSIVAVRICNSSGQNTNSFDLAEDIVIEIVYKVRRAAAGLQLTVTIARNMVDVLHSFDTDGDAELPMREPGVYTTIYRIPGMSLKAGSYSASAFIGTPEVLLQSLEHVLAFDVEEWSVNTQSKGYRRERPGLLISPGKWETRFSNGDL
jgi:lipopolysaccharide transport system ATP-binding protein